MFVSRAARGLATAKRPLARAAELGRVFSGQSLLLPCLERLERQCSSQTREQSTLGGGAQQIRQTIVNHPAPPKTRAAFPEMVGEGVAPLFAIIKLGNTQYKVVQDDVIVAEKVHVDIGQTKDITDVLLVGTRESTIIGRPVVPNAVVKLFVEEQTLDKKVIVFKKRRRKDSQRKNGFRRQVTLLRVVDISLNGASVGGTASQSEEGEET